MVCSNQKGGDTISFYNSLQFTKMWKIALTFWTKNTLKLAWSLVIWLRSGPLSEVRPMENWSVCWTKIPFGAWKMVWLLWLPLCYSWTWTAMSCKIVFSVVMAIFLKLCIILRVLPDMIGGNGYQQQPNGELIVRWTQANTFMPVMQFSFLPWDYADEIPVN